MIDTIIFDFDGTLADTTRLVIDAFKHIYEYYDKEYDEEYVFSTFGEPIKSVLARDFADHDNQEVLDIYRGHQKENEDKIVLYPKVEETIIELKKRDIKLGIATSRLRPSCIDYLENLGIKSYFKSIVTVNDVKKPKPHPEPIEKAMGELNSKAKNTIYVGDSSYDIESAQNAKVTPALVNWHSNSRELAEKYRVDYLLDSMWELVSIVS